MSAKEIVLQALKNIFNKESKIYILVPGFLGNYEEGLMQRLLDYFVLNKINVVAVEIPGYENTDGVLLPPLGEIINLIEDTYSSLRNEFKLNEIEIISHSQGCLTTLYASSIFDSNTKLLLLAPSIFLDKTVLKRITQDEYEKIKKNEVVLCKVSSEKYKLINSACVDSYEYYPNATNIPDTSLALDIIRPENDSVDIANIEFIKQKFPQSKIVLIEGDHIFKNPESAFTELLNIVL